MLFLRIWKDMSLTCAKRGDKSLWTGAVEAFIRSLATCPVISTWVWNAWILDGFQSRIWTKWNDKDQKIKAIKVILSYEIYRAFIVFQNDERIYKKNFSPVHLKPSPLNPSLQMHCPLWQVAFTSHLRHKFSVFCDDGKDIAWISSVYCIYLELITFPFDALYEHSIFWTLSCIGGENWMTYLHISALYNPVDMRSSNVKSLCPSPLESLCTC